MKRLFKAIRSLLPEALERRIGRVLWIIKVIGRNLLLAFGWRGQKPRVYIHHHSQITINPIWSSYGTFPPLRYAPYPIAELCHWVSSSFPMQLSARKKHIIDIEHTLIIAERLAKHYWPPMVEWHLTQSHREQVRQFVAQSQLRVLLTFSAGLVEHFKTHLAPELWHKVQYIHPSYPAPPEQPHNQDQPFTILVIASRFSDKGLPEAFRAFEILRERHGGKVRMILVSQAVPKNYRLPDGIIHHDVPLMSPEFRTEVYRLADVLLLPNYGETVACFPEAYAAGAPVITTRIHHGNEFVREGITGYLLDTPIYAFEEKFGMHWKTAQAFLDELALVRERGQLEQVVEQCVDYLEEMISGKVNMPAMRQAAREFYQDHFTVEMRNEKLRALYASALMP